MDIPLMMMALLVKMNTIYEKIESAAVRLNIDDGLQQKSTKKSQVKITQLKKGGQTNET